MFDHPELHGPHFDARLIGPDGKLARLHKGAPPPPPPPPPPVRESAPDVQAAKDEERKYAANRRGLNATLFNNQQQNQTGGKTLLGQ